MALISRRITPCFLTLFAGLNILNAISIDDYSTTAHNRFANDDTFIADSFDLSGIGIADSGRWLTMVSSNVFFMRAPLLPPRITLM